MHLLLSDHYDNDNKKMKLDFYFDVISPYTYFAFVILSRYRSFWNLDVSFKPFFLGGIMAGSNNTPPAYVPNRARFLAEDLKRNVAWIGLEGKFLYMPSNFFSPNVNKVTMELNRFLCVVLARGNLSEDAKWNLVSECFKFFWEDSANRNSDNEFVVENKVIETVCERAGLGDLVRYIPDVSTEGKRVLTENTSAALGLHAFGSPVLHFHQNDPVIFFGSDRFEQIAFLLNLKWFGPRGPGTSRL